MIGMMTRWQSQKNNVSGILNDNIMKRSNFLASIAAIFLAPFVKAKKTKGLVCVFTPGEWYMMGDVSRNPPLIKENSPLLYSKDGVEWKEIRDIKSKKTV